MSEVFVSYKREDFVAVKRLVDGLTAEGLDIWWDQMIAPDAPWEETIERQLSAAKAVIACWSRISVASENVKAEARRARQEGRLLQVYLEDCEPPLFFGERQGVKLRDWNGDRTSSQYRALVDGLNAVLTGRNASEAVGYVPPAAAEHWANVDKNDVAALLRYSDSFPGTSEGYQARQLAHQLEEGRKIRADGRAAYLAMIDDALKIAESASSGLRNTRHNLGSQTLEQRGERLSHHKATLAKFRAEWARIEGSILEPGGHGVLESGEIAGYRKRFAAAESELAALIRDEEDFLEGIRRIVSGRRFRVRALWVVGVTALLVFWLWAALQQGLL